MAQHGEFPPEIKTPAAYDGDEWNAFAVKEITEEGVFEGYASVFGKRDLQDDVVERGAFKRTLHHKKGKFPLFWQHDQKEVIGQVEAKEDERGLKVKGKLVLAAARANEIYSFVKEKIVTGLSIGFRTIVDEIDRETGVRHLKELDLWEVSAVVFPANPFARIRKVKGLSYESLPLAPVDAPWDREGAVLRVREFTDSKGGPSLGYKRAFLWHDQEKADDFGSYHFPIADVVDDRLTAIPGAIFAAAAAVFGAGRAGTKEFPACAHSAVKDLLARYYRRVGRTPPWEGKASFDEELRSMVELLEYADPDQLKDLHSAIERQPNSSPERPFGWIDSWKSGLEPTGNAPEPHPFSWIEEMKGELSHA